MSFGFSVGDFLTAASLTCEIISALRNDSRASYQQLILEIHGLQRALDEIEHLRVPPGQEVAINGIKVAALTCQHPLEEFSKKLKKYKDLGEFNGNQRGRTDKVKVSGRKVQWAFSMEDEVARFRAYLVAHVGSLNMRLLTQGL